MRNQKKNRIVNMLKIIFAVTFLNFLPSFVQADARVMNAGEAKGQLVFLTSTDIETRSPKFLGLTPLSIPVFEQLPVELAVVAGAITMQQQNLLSHVQLKSRARKTPNLDISELAGGMSSDLLKTFKDGDWIHMLLEKDGRIVLEASNEADAVAFAKTKRMEPIKLQADFTDKRIFNTSENGWQDFVKIGSKGANYAELFKVLNTADRVVVRPGFAVPFYYYQEFIEMNPDIKTAIHKVLIDPLMKKVSKVEYREQKLKALRDMIQSDQSKINPVLVDELIRRMDLEKDSDGLPRKFKLRSSTNAEDLPNFNGAGLYSSLTYKPYKKDKEISREAKLVAVKKAMRLVWSSIWNYKAFEERSYFEIPHEEVAMGIQIKPSFSNEEVDGVLVTKNIAKDPKLKGPGVYFEAQRGDEYGVANPKSGDRPERILVLYDEANPLDQTAYRIHVLSKSNIADDKKTVLANDNPSPIMSDAEIKDLIALALKAHIQFKPTVGENAADFALDLEFKVDTKDTGNRRIYYEQARPYIE